MTKLQIEPRKDDKGLWLIDFCSFKAPIIKFQTEEVIVIEYIGTPMINDQIIADTALTSTGDMNLKIPGSKSHNPKGMVGFYYNDVTQLALLPRLFLQHDSV